MRMRQAVRCALLVGAAMLPVSGLAQLNPTVKVLPRATAPVPAECEQGLSEQPAQRLAADEKASVRDTSLDMKAPPSATLRGELRAAVEAAQAGTPDAFRDSLTRAKSILSGYPPGGERTAATEVVGVLDDITRLWDFEFTSPTGSFIADGSDIFKMVSRYPGYEAYVRRQVITDRNGIRFYPTRETRQFLAGIGAERYARVTGGPLPPRAATRETVTETQVQPRTQTSKPPTTTQREPAPRAATTTHTATTTTPRPKTKRPPSASSHRTEKQTPVVREAHKAPAPKPRATTQGSPVKPKPTPPLTPTTSAAKTVPTTKPATTASVEPPPVLPAPVPTTESTATSSTSTMVTETPTDTSMTTDTSSTATTSTTTNTQTRSRGFVIPLILILVGVGVLVLLLRASS